MKLTKKSKPTSAFLLGTGLFASLALAKGGEITRTPKRYFQDLVATDDCIDTWLKLSHDIYHLLDWYDYDAPVRMETDMNYHDFTRPWEELAQKAFAHLETVRQRLEPMEERDDNEDDIKEVEQQLSGYGINSVLEAIETLDQLENDLHKPPILVESLMGIMNQTPFDADNPGIPIKWLLKTKAIDRTKDVAEWRPQRPIQIFKLLSLVDKLFDELGETFQNQMAFIQGLSPQKTKMAANHDFEAMGAYCTYYSHLVKRIMKDIYNISGTKTFQNLYVVSGLTPPILSLKNEAATLAEDSLLNSDVILESIKQQSETLHGQLDKKSIEHVGSNPVSD